MISKNSFVRFVVNPTDGYFVRKGFLKVIGIVVLLLILKFGFTLAYILLDSFLTDTYGFEIPQKAALNKSTDNSRYLKAILWAPLLEELAFRLSLRFRKHYIVLSFLLILYLTLKIFGFVFFEAATLSLVLALVFGWAIYKSPISFKIKNMYKHNYGLVFYVFALYFALAHASNFDVGTNNFYWIPFIILPHLLGSLIYGYLRVQFNFMTGLLSHSLWNFLISISIMT